MAFDPERSLGDEEEEGVNLTPAPQMLRHLTEAPPSLGHVGDGAPLRALRHELAAQVSLRQPPRRGELRTGARAWATRLSGRADHRLVLAVARAVNALAEYCDALGDRVTSLEHVSGETTQVFSREITVLRAEVIHLRELLGSLEQPRNE